MYNNEDKDEENQKQIRTNQKDSKLSTYELLMTKLSVSYLVALSHVLITMIIRRARII